MSTWVRRDVLGTTGLQGSAKQLSKHHGTLTSDMLKTQGISLAFRPSPQAFDMPPSSSGPAAVAGRRRAMKMAMLID